MSKSELDELDELAKKLSVQFRRSIDSATIIHMMGGGLLAGNFGIESDLPLGYNPSPRVVTSKDTDAVRFSVESRIKAKGLDMVAINIELDKISKRDIDSFCSSKEGKRWVAKYRTLLNKSKEQSEAITKPPIVNGKVDYKAILIKDWKEVKGDEFDIEI